MKHKAVIGLGFGDEGKGLVTNYLCQQDNSAVVVRFSGGQQAGHTVVKHNFRHVFSNFGSGTLNGNMTYWSKYCTFDPVSFVNEYKILKEHLYNPIIQIDKNCPITTPYEKHFLGNSIIHGTCGVGVGQTWERESNHVSLTFEDLFDSTILTIKLQLIEDYYGCGLIDQSDFFLALDFIEWATTIPHHSDSIPENVNLIFEGSQGLLLDQNIGFFPHVTRSNTGSKNIFELGYIPEFFMVTRAYQTRHGNGPMTNFNVEHNIKLNSQETNVFNEFQGNFRVSLLDLNLLKYGLEKDTILSKNKDNLVITCLDHIQDNYQLTLNGKIRTFSNEENFIEFISNYLGFKSVYISKSDKSEEIKKII